ncbi:zinc finger CCHC domain-containing protein 7-like, partial [Pholidichthys leucotaenia]
LRKKCPICVLCGIEGHIQRNCPGRPCPRCGLPSHDLRPCVLPPVSNQLCQRCGMTGHLSDVCPDTWRQYHLTIKSDIPHKPETVHNLKHKRSRAHCYNCSKTGHYGFECAGRRMVTGTFPSLPYICHYDTKEDILQLQTRMHERAKELVSAGSPPLLEIPHLFEEAIENSERTKVFQWNRRKWSHSQTGRKKTWPERRREKQEVKRLRREAQAKREGGLLGKSCGASDEVCDTESRSPPKKKRRVSGGIKSRKSREAERWRKRGGLKRGYLYPHGDMDIGSVNLLSPKQRVRHRRR